MGEGSIYFEEQNIINPQSLSLNYQGHTLVNLLQTRGILWWEVTSLVEETLEDLISCYIPESLWIGHFTYTHSHPCL